MTEKNSEPQLADEARTALLKGVINAAEAGNGESAKAMAEAFVIIDKSTPSESSSGGPVVNYSSRPRTR